MNLRHKCLALALTTSLAFFGCSAGTGDQNASPAAGGPPNGDGDGFLSFSLNLGPLGPNDRADVLMINAPDPGDPTNIGVNINNTTGRESEPPSAVSEGRDRPFHREQADLASFEAGRSVQPRFDETIQPRFEEIPQGGSFDFTLDGTVIPCQKILSEAQTVHCEIFAEVVDGTPVLDPASAVVVAQAWDSDNPARPGSGIYDQVRAQFGSEWNVNPAGGRDGDEKVVLVFLTEESAGGDGTFGFFRPVDELTKSQFPDSNQGEILYLNANVAPFDLLATLAHEFQHLVRFNQKVVQQGTFAGTNEDRTINEGCSVNAEEICGYSLTAPGGGNSFIFSTSRAYLNAAGSFNLFEGFNNGGRYYGGGYLLVKYFREQFGDAAFVTFNTNTAVGYDNMANVSGVGRYELWRRFSLAMLASGFAGSVPPEALFPSGFTTNGTYDVRDLGLATLPGLQPKQTLDASAQLNTSIIPYSVTLARITGGSTGDVVLLGAVGGVTIFDVLLQSPPGTVVNEVQQNFGL